MYEDIEVNDLIKFFKSLQCREDAPQTSFSIYADYLSEWYERFQNGEEKFSLRLISLSTMKQNDKEHRNTLNIRLQ